MVKIFVVSLKSALERRNHIQQQFDTIGVPFRFFDAVDGRVDQHPVFEQYDEKKGLRRKGYSLTAGELGCFTSHYSLWQKCVELNEPIVVIEDDAELEPGFKEAVKEIEALSPFGYVRLFVNGRYRPYKIIDRFGKYDIVQYLRGPSAARAYFLTPGSAKKFLHSAREFCLPVDDHMDQFWVHDVPCRGLMPGIVKNETGFDSSIGEVNKKKKSNKFTREISSLVSAFSRKLYVFKNPPDRTRSILNLLWAWIGTTDPSRKFRAEIDLMYWGRRRSRLIRKWFQRRIFYKYNCDISHQSRIHPTVIFPHPSGVIIGSKAVVNEGCRVYQQVTIGSNFSRANEMATVGKNTCISAGAKLIGGVSIGENSVIGANAVVTKDVKPGGVIVGANLDLSGRSVAPEN
ncbi:MAG: glycosyltransferase family 25 protein [Marinobacter sp.]|nr:glycosyltransferase family 25 protein [Marinobacter sp.]